MIITDIFLPKKIHNYTILSQRILGFDLSKTHVYATQIYISGKNIVIEKFFQETLDTDINEPYIDRVARALKAIIQSTSGIDVINTSLSSSIVIFKTIELPFCDEEKIAAVIEYEIEPHLPFAIQDVIIDFVVTQCNQQEQRSEVLVASVQKQYIETHLSYFAAAGLDPDKISVDLLDLYGLYKAIPYYTQQPTTVVLIDIELHVTRIACIKEGMLTFVRTLNKGLVHIAKQLAVASATNNGQALEDLIRFGTEKYNDKAYVAMVRSSFEQFTQDIYFTLQAFMQQSRINTIDKILLLGHGADINGITTLMQELIGIPCEFFQVDEILKVPTISIKNSSRIPRVTTMSLATAFPSSTVEHFNLRKKEFIQDTSFLFLKRLIAGIILLCFIFGALITHSIWQQRALKNTIQAMEQGVIKTLKDRKLTESNQFTQSIATAQEKINSDEALWFGFSRQQRFSFLKTLQDLSMAIDQKSLGLEIQKLVITPEHITLEGSVKGFEELKTLERELQESKLFKFVPALQELRFSEQLLLKKNGEEAA